MKARVFDDSLWFTKEYDGRRAEFKGITRKAFELAVKLHIRRENERAKMAYMANKADRVARYKEAREVLDAMPWRGEAHITGYEDYKCYKTMGVDCAGNEYVAAIAPAERGNNVYYYNRLIVKHYKKAMWQRVTANI